MRNLVWAPSDRPLPPPPLKNPGYAPVCSFENKLNLEKLTVWLGLTIVYFPIFRQARPDSLQGMFTTEKSNVRRRKRKRTYGVTLDIIYPFTTFHCSKFILFRCLTAIKPRPDDRNILKGQYHELCMCHISIETLKNPSGIFQVWIR